MFKEIKANYDLANNTESVKRGETNWYILASVIIKELKNNNINNTDEILLSHIFECIDFDSTLKILEYFQLYNELSDFEKQVKKYYDDERLENDKIKWPF